VDWSVFSPVPVIGVDEAGRGCLAGPVCAGAVILVKKVKRGTFGDSKTLSASRREELFELIQLEHQWGVGFASVEEIERLNIFRASLLAMKRAIGALKVKGGHALVDGKFKIPGLKGFEQTALIKGDARCAPISAASIVAKVSRDRLMVELAEKFPSYGFEIHKGYATELHRARISEHGPCEHHRRTFAGVVDL
jgi:ribonuclease HII